jgi:hypothetical protein
MDRKMIKTYQNSIYPTVWVFRSNESKMAIYATSTLLLCSSTVDKGCELSWPIIQGRRTVNDTPLPHSQPSFVRLVLPYIGVGKER